MDISQETLFTHVVYDVILAPEYDHVIIHIPSLPTSGHQ